MSTKISNDVEHVCFVLHTVLNSMLDRPQDLRIVSHQSSTGTVLKVYCHPGDVSKIIGKQGRTVKALRVILLAVAKTGSYHLDVTQVGLNEGQKDLLRAEAIT